MQTHEHGRTGAAARPTRHLAVVRLSRGADPVNGPWFNAPLALETFLERFQTTLEDPRTGRKVAL